MTKTNNLKHLKRNFSLILLNTIIVTVLFAMNIIPVSTLVMITMIPAVVFSIYTKKWFLILITCVTFTISLLLFFMTFLAPGLIVEGMEALTLIAYLYSKIYPYGISVSILQLINITLLLYLSLFMLCVLCISILIKYSEFTTMIGFSFAVLYINLIYFLINILAYLFPFLLMFMIENVITQYIFMFFYVIIPFIVLNFMLLYCELVLLDTFKQRDYQSEARKLSKGQKEERFNKTLLVIVVITITLMIIGGLTCS